MQKILVIGSNGQLGSEIRELSLTDTTLEFVFTDYPEIDITDEQAVRKAIACHQPTAIINCAAYTAVDLAEDETDKARTVNATGPGILARVANEFGIRLLHISTDYVFDGEAFAPYTEEQLTNPIGVYGLTKREGEQEVFQNCEQAVIIRTSWLYSSFGNNFVKTMLRLMDQRDELGVIFDQVGTPTYAADLAKACLQVITAAEFEQKAGIYHFSNEGVASWYDFALAIRDLSGLTCRVKPLKTAEYPTKSKRPHYSVLDKSKIKTAFGVRVPYWRDSLKGCLELLAEESIQHTFCS